MKQYNIKVFEKDGTTLLKNISPLLKSPPTFPAKINSGLGELVLDLNLPFNTFPSYLSGDNIVDVYCIDDDHPRGRRIYRGFISIIDPYIEREEGIRVTCLGLASITTFNPYKNGSLFTVTHTAVDPAVIFQAIVTHINSIIPGSLFTASTETVGTAVSKTFENVQWDQAIDQTRELCGAGWYTYIDQDGVCHLKAKPSTATHAFTIGKDIESLSAPKSNERIINDIVVQWEDFSNDTQTSTFTDAASVSAFWTRSLFIDDSSIRDSNGASQRGNKELADNKDEKVQAKLVINSNYDLESIKPGDTCKIRNIKSNSFLNDNLQIYSVQYDGDTVTLQLEEFVSNFGVTLGQFVNG